MKELACQENLDQEIANADWNYGKADAFSTGWYSQLKETFTPEGRNVSFVLPGDDPMVNAEHDHLPNAQNANDQIQNHVEVTLKSEFHGQVLVGQRSKTERQVVIDGLEAVKLSVV